MKDSYEQCIQNKFGGFCIRVLKNEARYIHRSDVRRCKREKSLSCLTESEFEQTSTTDKYFMDEHVFVVREIPIVVIGNLLAEAIGKLSNDKREVILLSYFVGLSDREIGERLHLVRQTISKRRLASLRELHRYLTKEGFEWPIL